MTNTIYLVQVYFNHEELPDCDVLHHADLFDDKSKALAKANEYEEEYYSNPWFVGVKVQEATILEE